jgi:predicted nucleic acid-binding protein
VRFWDTSALVPLLVPVERSDRMAALVREDPGTAVWWITPVECASALARLARADRLSRGDLALGARRLSAAAEGWSEVPPTELVRDQAHRLLRLHALRAADALQLAAALILAEHDPKTLPFVTLDDRLAAAAEREGFSVLGR